MSKAPSRIALLVATRAEVEEAEGGVGEVIRAPDRALEAAQAQAQAADLDQVPAAALGAAPALEVGRAPAQVVAPEVDLGPEGVREAEVRADLGLARAEGAVLAPAPEQEAECLRIALALGLIS